ncbi:MAG: molecular chaperone HtpG [Clostridiales bacterium]|nr:molecular chaperone HtpG [Clostridiales bacterium]
MAQEKGNLSINSENFLPIIKKWLYTDKDIFIRELISNGCDAVTKLMKLKSIGEADHIADDEKYQIVVSADPEKKTLSFTDNGIGMTAEEIKKYINQIAFSGATDFLSKYEEKMDKDNEIIGHFGLGFYSAFMIADKVEINSLSYQKGAVAAKWICDGGIEYEMSDSEKSDRGTTITLYVGDDGQEFLNEYTLRSTIEKYCSFMPVEIYLEIVKPKENTEEKENAESTASPETPKPLNDIHPLWLKQPKDCTEEEYKEFYHKVFFEMGDPLFWIHLNMDYPFRLKGILYFPKLSNEMDAANGQIKLYSNQVYIADNIKEVVPEFLLLLKGVMDCPDLPLNVSRSTLQNDGYASKMSSYITKKVADKLNQLFKTDRSSYEKFFDDISIFIKYGCMKGEKLYEKIKDSIIYKTTNNTHKTLAEYLEDNKDKNANKVFYVTDANQQAQYIQLFKDQAMEAIILDASIDKAFISFLEYTEKNETKFLRIDADISDTLKNAEETSEEAVKAKETLDTSLQTLFRGILNDEKLKVKTESLKSTAISAMMLLSEESRRMVEMREMYRNQDMMAGIFGSFELDRTLVLNSNNKLIQLLIELKNKGTHMEETDLICHQVYDLAQMGQKPLEPAEMTTFIERSNQILEKLIELETK